MKGLTLTLAIVLAILGIIVYEVYQLFGADGPLNKDAPQNQDLSNPGQALSPVDRVDNWLFPQNFPGQTGEYSGTSQTYTGAFAEEFLHPIDTIKGFFE